MLYLKYRPKNISELDNTRVKELVCKLLDSKEIPHALLFIGQKGTGKTTTARIVAKTLNCLENIYSGKSKNIEPCNKCDNCKSISTSTFTDVIEMDAASNRGIEDVKNLIKETSFLPMTGRFRVFIIDEVHMITTDGFNALLKTLEEPPSTAVFILATTNPEKLPKTILSRCLQVNFGKGLEKDIISMLKKIITSENKSLPDMSIKLIAKHADHSFRDATKILEELLIQNIIQPEEVEKYLGIRGKNNLLEMIETNNEKAVFNWIVEFSESGGNFKNLIEELLNELHARLLQKKGINIEDAGNKTTLTLNQITKLIKLLLDAYQQIKFSPIESLPLEIAMNEFYNKQ